MIFRKFVSLSEAKKIWPNDKVYSEKDELIFNDGFTKIDPEILTLLQEKIIAHLLQEQFREDDEKRNRIIDI